MKVKPKLFLNMSPQTQEDGSLAFARNMKIDDDGNLVSDYGYENISSMTGYDILGHIVGLDNKIYFFCAKHVSSRIGYVIVEYDEVEKTKQELNTAWSYGGREFGGSEIDGYVSTNQSGEKILTVGEYVEDGSTIPLKHINLTYATSEDDESIYTQAPKCPTANLALTDTYVKTIPNGVYVFFIRYKIRKDVYTNWFLCSRPIFGGTSEEVTTFQGGLKFVNLHKDSAKSFVFSLSFAQTANIDSYSEFQLGFIITHDEATDARTWKHFNMSNFKNGGTIYFDYESVLDANIDDLLETTYELYNVRNITAFKNKLYISNYKESNFNYKVNNISNVIDISSTLIDNTTSNINKHNTVSVKLNNTYYTLTDYNETYGCYTRINGNNIYSQAYNIDLDFSISDFYKGESLELEKAIILKLIGNVDENPDIIYVSSLENNLYGSPLFGYDFLRQYNSGGYDGWNAIGLTVAKSLTEQILNVSRYYTYKHPLDDYGFTFAYGLFGEAGNVPSSSSAYSKGNVLFINKESLNAGKACASSRFIDDYVRITIADNIKKEIKDKNRFIIGYVTLYDGVEKYTLRVLTDKSTFERDDFVGNDYTTDYGINNRNNSSASVIVNAIQSNIRSIIYDKCVGIDENGNFVLNINGNYIKVNNVTFTFKTCEFDTDNGSEIETNSDGFYNYKFETTLKTTYYNCMCSYNIKASSIKITKPTYTDTIYKQTSTLLPLSSYNVYIHFVDNHNIVTNGQFVKNIRTSYSTNEFYKILLTYRVIDKSSISPDYTSFFLSIKNVGPIVIECFGYKYVDGFHTLNVLEADALLYNLNDSIKIYINNSDSPITSDAVYYPSGASNPSLAFGNCGFIAWSGGGSYTESTRFYVKIDRNLQYDKSTPLIKATPYISLQNTSYYVTVNDGFYDSYFCAVKKPSITLASKCYISGNDIYSATRSTPIKLKEFDSFITTQDSSTYFIRSAFNLNYLSLTEDITDRIYSIGDISSNLKQVVKVVNSAILSFIYELKSMYRDFLNKTFKEFDKDYKIDFDNTVRVSHVLSDETFNNSVFKFSAEDYYNVPTDRGVIVNLFSIGNNIFVHTKTSFYKFDGNQTITASDKDITLQESEPFNAGITQLFDSEFGYGGINNKEAGCITFDSYVFYDAMSNHIFAYGGNSQVQIIDASIYKLLCYYKPTFCRTLHDDANHRVLFEFTVDNKDSDYNKFTISYNYKSKSFVSFHDLSLEKSFHSRYISYSYRGEMCSLFNTENEIDTYPIYPSLNVCRLYGGASEVCIMLFGAETQDIQSSPFNIAVVTFPQQNFREVINSLKYVGSVIQDNYDERADYNIIKIPQITRTNPVSKFYIITDRCVSTPVSDDVNDAQRPANPNDYKGFKYDMGSWNTNYFRNALNDTNVYQYPNQPGVNEPVAGGQSVTRHPNTDNNSLVYGKYFILVFDFIKNKPIKFEEVSVNSNQY